MSGLKSPDGLRRELGFSPAKKTTSGCFQDYSARHYPLITFNKQLSVVLARLREQTY
jgi:hypothetical protein